MDLPRLLNPSSARSLASLRGAGTEPGPSLTDRMVFRLRPRRRSVARLRALFAADFSVPTRESRSRDRLTDPRRLARAGVVAGILVILAALLATSHAPPPPVTHVPTGTSPTDNPAPVTAPTSAGATDPSNRPPATRHARVKPSAGAAVPHPARPAATTGSTRARAASTVSNRPASASPRSVHATASASPQPVPTHSQPTEGGRAATGQTTPAGVPATNATPVASPAQVIFQTCRSQTAACWPGAASPRGAQVLAQAPAMSRAAFGNVALGSSAAALVLAHGVPLTSTQLPEVFGRSDAQQLIAGRPQGDTCSYYLGLAARQSTAFEFCFTPSGALARKLVLTASDVLATMETTAPH